MGTMEVYEDFRTIATAMRPMSRVQVRGTVSWRGAQRLRDMADAYNVTEEEMCSGLLDMVVDHPEHVKVYALDTSTNLPVFSETVTDPTSVLHDLLDKGFDVHIHRVEGPAGHTYRAWVDGPSDKVEIDAYGSSLGGTIKSLPGEIAKKHPSDE